MAKRIPDSPVTRTLPELTQRYRLEPTIRDVFVEGRSDASVVKRFLRSKNLRDVSVYEISTVDIPAVDLSNSNLPNGVRARVVYLALEFERQLPNDLKAPTCIADRDYDEILKKKYHSAFLLLSDYSCVEMYAYNAETISNLLSAVAPSLENKAEQLLEQLRPLLQSLFAIRAANINLRLNLKWLSSFCDDCTIEETSIHFDEAAFIGRYLNKNSQLAELDRFTAEVGRLKLLIKGEPRLFIRGHDFVEALSWFLRERTSRSSPNYKVEVLEQLLLAHIDRDRLEHEPLFAKLVKRIT